MKLGDEHLRGLGLGLSGAHRTGKTTVAKRLQTEKGCPFVTSSASAVAKELGIVADAQLPPEDRRRLQERILEKAVEAYENEGGNGLFVTDRTPLDFAAYALADWGMAADAEHEAWIIDYVDRCMDATSRYFFMVGVIQPGILYVKDEGKPEPNDLYQEVVNTNVIGLARNPRVRAYLTVIERYERDTKARASKLAQDYDARVERYRANLANTLTTQ